MTKQQSRLLPLLLTAGIVALDQLTKVIIINTIPLNRVGVHVIGDHFRIVHVRNLGAAFSLGANAPEPIRIFMMKVVPFILIIGLIYLIVKSDEVTVLQRWALAGIAGGGIGNVLIDRLFRPLGVVDFLDFRFYGLFGLERWPTFNVADMAAVICSILLGISLVAEAVRGDQNQSKDGGEFNE